jgi:DNA-binding transcriptional ArsR family regulator
MNSAIPKRDDVAGAFYAEMACLRDEARNILRCPERLTGLAPDLGEARVARALDTVKRIGIYRFTGPQLAKLFSAQVDARLRLASMDDKQAADVFRFEALADVLEVEDAAEEAGEAAYTEAVDILYAKEKRAARIAKLPPIMTGAELMATDFGPRRDRVKGVIPEAGAVIIAGGKASGKTFLAMQLAVAIGAGRPWLGFETLPCRVLVIERELTAKTLQDRFKKMGIDQPINVDFAYNWSRGTEAITDIEAIVLERGYQVVILDVAAVFREKGADGNDYQGGYDFYGPLRQTANRLKIIIASLTHNKKGGAEEASEAIMGSYSQAGASDVIISLKRASGKDKGIIVLDGNDIEYQEIAVSFFECLFTRIDEDPQEARLTPERREVLAALREVEDAKASELSSRLGKDSDVVSKLLRALADAHLAEKIASGRYRASRNGRSGRNAERPTEESKDTPTETTPPTASTESEPQFSFEGIAGLAAETPAAEQPTFDIFNEAPAKKLSLEVFRLIEDMKSKGFIQRGAP